MTAHRLQPLLLVALMVGIGAFALAHPVRMPDVPPRVAATAAQAWMVEALPWVGPKTASKAIHAVQTGRLTDLPARARAIASETFVWPESR